MLQLGARTLLTVGWGHVCYTLAENLAHILKLCMSLKLRVVDSISERKFQSCPVSWLVHWYYWMLWARSTVKFRNKRYSQRHKSFYVCQKERACKAGSKESVISGKININKKQVLYIRAIEKMAWGISGISQTLPITSSKMKKWKSSIWEESSRLPCSFRIIEENVSSDSVI